MEKLAGPTFVKCMGCFHSIHAYNLVKWIDYTLVSGWEKGIFHVVTFEYWICPTCFDAQLVKRRANRFARGKDGDA